MTKSIAAIACSGFLLTACENSDSQGNLNLAITDAPVDGADEVWITFDAVTIKPEQGDAQTYDVDPPKKINLLNLTGTSSTELLNQPLDAGRYSWIRLSIDDADNSTYLVNSTGTHSLRIPSGNQTGLKLNRSFSIDADVETAFTIDFDLRKSIHMTGSGSYMMRPTLRIVETSMAGSISGSIDPSLVTEGCYPGVYVFNEGDPVDDMDGVDDPVVALSISMSDNGTYNYTAGFLSAGNYTVAYTCEANLDDAPDGVNENDDVIDFTQQAIVTVTTGANSEYNFAP
ncbi:MAG TPA: DUF4382 domain-containing protein [Gammaproteobacteria bacterium]